jgi:hypothetical protein
MGFHPFSIFFFDFIKKITQFKVLKKKKISILRKPIRAKIGSRGEATIKLSFGNSKAR